MARPSAGAGTGRAIPGRSPGGGSPVCTGLLAVLALLSPARVAAQFSVQPVIVELAAGDTAAAVVVEVRNEDSRPLQLRAYAADFEQPEGGGHIFFEPGTHPRSCADRLRFYPDGVTLAPDETGEIRVLMERVDSTCWSVLFVESAARAQAGLSIAQRIGVKVYGLPARTVTDGEIRAVDVVRDSTRAVLAHFANQGTRPVRPEGEIEVRTLEGEVVAVVPVPAFSVLPDRVRRTRVELDIELAPGTYVLVPILDFGGEYLAGGQAIMDVPAP